MAYFPHFYPFAEPALRFAKKKGKSQPAEGAIQEAEAKARTDWKVEEEGAA